jgi:hypothetical protein
MAATKKRSSRRSSRRSRPSASPRRHGNAAKTGWAAGRRPSHAEIWANGKPIEIRKIGSKWALGVMGHPVTRLPTGGLTFRGRADFVDGLGAALFTKSDARFLAHKIGHYMLGLGDLVDTYTAGY